MKHVGMMTAMVMALGAVGPVIAGISTSTTTTTTPTTVTSTTTSTSSTLPFTCGSALTFTAIACRLDELAAQVAAAEPNLGKLGPKLSKALGKAETALNRGSEACAAGNTKKAGKQLKKAIRRMIQFNHRLGSLKARKAVPEEVRRPLLDTGRPLQNDMKTMKRGLTCPQPGSPSGAFVH